MKQSIETVWKEGFIKENALIAPKIIDLYNQKSENLIDKFHRMFRINRLAIIAAEIVLLVVLSLLGLPYLGVFIFLALSVLLMVGKDGMKKLDALDKTSNSYHYLKSFSKWRKDVEAVYTRTYAFFYPLVFLALAVQFRFSSDGASIIKNMILDSPDMLLWMGIPVFMLAGVAIIAAVLAYFAGPMYRLDVDLVYGPSFNKLDELIAEMEELKS